MILKSKSLIQFYERDELTKGYFITSNTQMYVDLSTDEWKIVLNDISNMQNELGYPTSIVIRDILFPQDIQEALSIIQSEGLKGLTLMGNLDGADLSRISDFVFLESLVIDHNGKSNVEGQMGKANFGTIILPPNVQFVGLVNISEESKIDTSNMSESKRNLLKIDRKEEEYKPKIKIIKSVNEYTPNEEDSIYWDYIQVGKYRYLPEEYSVLYERLLDLVKDIDSDLSEEQRVMILYKRVAKKIEYDFTAAYPINSSEEARYAKNEQANSRSLKNGLLYGKCLCAGYAEILRNACSLIGIEAQCADIFFKKTVRMWNEEKQKVVEKQIEIGHEWCKIKIDGVWYNFDACWDHDRILRGKEPLFVFETDFQRILYFKNITTAISGPSCTTVYKKHIDNRKGFFRNFFKAISGAGFLLPEPAPQPRHLRLSDKEIKPWDLRRFGTSKKIIQRRTGQVAARHMRETEIRKVSAKAIKIRGEK